MMLRPFHVYIIPVARRAQICSAINHHRIWWWAFRAIGRAFHICSVSTWLWRRQLFGLSNDTYLFFSFLCLLHQKPQQFHRVDNQTYQSAIEKVNKNNCDAFHSSAGVHTLHVFLKKFHILVWTRSEVIDRIHRTIVIVNSGWFVRTVRFWCAHEIHANS